MNFPFLIYPILAAMVAGEGKFLEKNAIWEYANKKQQYFLENFYSKRSELKYFAKNELTSWTSNNHDELNKIAKEKGFAIQFKPFAASEFGAISVFEIVEKWLQKGEKDLFEYNDLNYEAVKLESGFQILKSDFYRSLFVRINTQSGDRVYMTFADNDVNKDSFEVLRKIEYLAKLKKENSDVEFKYVVFPKVNFDKVVAIDWIKGMKSGSKIVNQALQQVKLKLDEDGAIIQSAMLMSLIESINPLRTDISFMRINKPFYIWIERDGCSAPIFAAYINEDSWVREKSFLEKINDKL